MADTKISGLTALTGANTASGDLLTIVDVSDTTMAATGTNKKITLTELQSAPVSAGTANGVLYLNGSKVATSGSALTFDNSNLFTLSTSTPVFRLTPSVNTALQGIEFGSAVVTDAFIKQQPSAGEFRISSGRSAGWGGFTSFYIDTVEAMRLTSTGLGIGTSSPAYKLEVNGQIGCADNFVFTTANPAMVVNSGYLRFFTGGSERLRLDTSGNLGLGVTPSAWGSTYRAAQIGLSSSLVGITNDVQTHLSTNARFDGTNWLYMATSPAARYMQDNNVHKWFSAASGTAGNAITFTQAMTLDASGNLLVGTTSAGASGVGPLVLNKATNPGFVVAYNGSEKAYQYMPSATRYRGETVTGVAVEFSAGNSNGVSLASGGTSWGSLSDERKKDIIEPITDAANKVSTLRAVIGKYKTDDESTRRSFLIAQDVQAVLPEAVVEDQSGDLILQYTETIPLLVAAIKEQQALIQQLTARVAQLESN